MRSADRQMDCPVFVVPHHYAVYLNKKHQLENFLRVKQRPEHAVYAESHHYSLRKNKHVTKLFFIFLQNTL